MLSVIPLDWLPASTWEALGVWIEALALIAIFFLDWQERREAREERRLQREAREDKRQEREEIHAERRRLEGDRQRGEVICVCLEVYTRDVTEEFLCNALWGRFANKQAGFAIDEKMYFQLSAYLTRKAAPFLERIEGKTIAKTARGWFIFKFPYPDYSAVFSDLRVMKLGEMLVAWDEAGKPVKVDKISQAHLPGGDAWSKSAVFPSRS